MQQSAAPSVKMAKRAAPSLAKTIKAITLQVVITLQCLCKEFSGMPRLKSKKKKMCYGHVLETR
jgi:hypothetical protein